MQMRYELKAAHWGNQRLSQIGVHGLCLSRCHYAAHGDGVLVVEL